MNWKPNLWTWLFALVLIAYLIQLSGMGYSTQSDRCGGLTGIDEIPAKVAFERYEKYISRYSLAIKDCESKLGLVNPVVKSFEIPTQDLFEAACAFPNGRVYAWLTIETDTSASQRDTLDLLLASFPAPNIDSLEFFNPIEYLDSIKKSGIDPRFFDFSKPCPPLCND